MDNVIVHQTSKIRVHALVASNELVRTDQTLHLIIRKLILEPVDSRKRRGKHQTLKDRKCHQRETDTSMTLGPGLTPTDHVADRFDSLKSVDKLLLFDRIGDDVIQHV